MRRRYDPGRIVEGPSGNEHVFRRIVRFMPEARSASGAAHVVRFAPAVCTLAIAGQLALLVTKPRAVGIDRQEIRRARELLAIAAMTGDRRDRCGVVRIAHGT